jgi:hypothetical protein
MHSVSSVGEPIVSRGSEVFSNAQLQMFEAMITRPGLRADIQHRFRRHQRSERQVYRRERPPNAAGRSRQ